MISRIKRLSDSQWIMLMTLALISTLLMVATRAEASGYSLSTNISHCGWVTAHDKNYTTHPRNTKIIQRKLEHMGYSVGTPGIDGRYGKLSKAAVRQFQTDHGLKADGVVGIETATYLAYASHPTANVRRCKYPYSGFAH